MKHQCSQVLRQLWKKWINIENVSYAQLEALKSNETSTETINLLMFYFEDLL